MAEAKKQEGGDAPAPPPKKKKLLLFIIIGVLVLVLGGAGAFFMLKKKPAEEGDGEEDNAPKKEVKHKKADASKLPTYLKLEPFVTNLASETGNEQGPAQYIQVTVELKVEDAHEADTIKAYTTEIRDKILRLLSSKKPSQLSAAEGKDTLSEEIRDQVNAIINPPPKKAKSEKAAKQAAAEGPVESVHFTSFIIQ